MTDPSSAMSANRLALPAELVTNSIDLWTPSISPVKKRKSEVEIKDINANIDGKVNGDVDGNSADKTVNDNNTGNENTTNNEDRYLTKSDGARLAYGATAAILKSQSDTQSALQQQQNQNHVNMNMMNQAHQSVSSQLSTELIRTQEVVEQEISKNTTQTQYLQQMVQLLQQQLVEANSKYQQQQNYLVQQQEKLINLEQAVNQTPQFISNQQAQQQLQMDAQQVKLDKIEQLLQATPQLMSDNKSGQNSRQTTPINSNSGQLGSTPVLNDFSFSMNTATGDENKLIGSGFNNYTNGNSQSDTSNSMNVNVSQGSAHNLNMQSTSKSNSSIRNPHLNQSRLEFSSQSNSGGANANFGCGGANSNVSKGNDVNQNANSTSQFLIGTPSFNLISPIDQLYTKTTSIEGKTNIVTEKLHADLSGSKQNQRYDLSNKQSIVADWRDINNSLSRCGVSLNSTRWQQIGGFLTGLGASIHTRINNQLGIQQLQTGKQLNEQDYGNALNTFRTRLESKHSINLTTLGSSIEQRFRNEVTIPEPLKQNYVAILSITEAILSLVEEGILDQSLRFGLEDTSISSREVADWKNKILDIVGQNGRLWLSHHVNDSTTLAETLSQVDAYANGVLEKQVKTEEQRERLIQQYNNYKNNKSINSTDNANEDSKIFNSFSNGTTNDQNEIKICSWCGRKHGTRCAWHPSQRSDQQSILFIKKNMQLRPKEGFPGYDSWNKTLQTKDHPALKGNNITTKPENDKNKGKVVHCYDWENKGQCSNQNCKFKLGHTSELKGKNVGKATNAKGKGKKALFNLVSSISQLTCQDAPNQANSDTYQQPQNQTDNADTTKSETVADLDQDKAMEQFMKAAGFLSYTAGQTTVDIPDDYDFQAILESDFDESNNNVARGIDNQQLQNHQEGEETSTNNNNTHDEFEEMMLQIKYNTFKFKFDLTNGNQDQEFNRWISQPGKVYRNKNNPQSDNKIEAILDSGANAHGFPVTHINKLQWYKRFNQEERHGNASSNTGVRIFGVGGLRCRLHDLQREIHMIVLVGNFTNFLISSHLMRRKNHVSDYSVDGQLYDWISDQWSSINVVNDRSTVVVESILDDNDAVQTQDFDDELACDSADQSRKMTVFNMTSTNNNPNSVNPDDILISKEYHEHVRSGHTTPLKNLGECPICLLASLKNEAQSNKFDFSTIDDMEIIQVDLSTDHTESVSGNKFAGVAVDLKSQVSKTRMLKSKEDAGYYILEKMIRFSTEVGKKIRYYYPDGEQCLNGGTKLRNLLIENSIRILPSRPYRHGQHGGVESVIGNLQRMTRINQLESNLPQTQWDLSWMHAEELRNSLVSTVRLKMSPYEKLGLKRRVELYQKKNVKYGCIGIYVALNDPNRPTKEEKLNGKCGIGMYVGLSTQRQYMILTNATEQNSVVFSNTFKPVKNGDLPRIITGVDNNGAMRVLMNDPRTISIKTDSNNIESGTDTDNQNPNINEFNENGSIPGIDGRLLQNQSAGSNGSGLINNGLINQEAFGDNQKLIAETELNTVPDQIDNHTNIVTPINLLDNDVQKVIYKNTNISNIDKINPALNAPKTKRQQQMMKNNNNGNNSRFLTFQQEIKINSNPQIIGQVKNHTGCKETWKVLNNDLEVGMEHLYIDSDGLITAENAINSQNFYQFQTIRHKEWEDEICSRFGFHGLNSRNNNDDDQSDSDNDDDIWNLNQKKSDTKESRKTVVNNTSEETVIQAEKDEIEKHDNAQAWRPASDQEVKEWINSGSPVLQVMMVYRTKIGSQGNNKAKARLVLLAHVLRRNYDCKSDAILRDQGSTPSFESILVQTCLDIILNRGNQIDDAASAFINSDYCPNIDPSLPLSPRQNRRLRPVLKLPALGGKPPRYMVALTAINGLSAGPRVYEIKRDLAMESIGFTRNIRDGGIRQECRTTFNEYGVMQYESEINAGHGVVLLHVDDSLESGYNLKIRQQLGKELKLEAAEVVTVGDWNIYKYLGCEFMINKNRTRCFIGQLGYVSKLISMTSNQNGTDNTMNRTVNIPIPPSFEAELSLALSQGEVPTEQQKKTQQVSNGITVQFSKTARHLLYAQRRLASASPVSITIKRLFQYQHYIKTHRWISAICPDENKIKEIRSAILPDGSYQKDKVVSFGIKCFTDSDFASECDQRSITGISLTICGANIINRSTKMNHTVTNVLDSELVGAAEGTKTSLGVTELINSTGIIPPNWVDQDIAIDNSAAVTISSNRSLNKKSRHLRTREMFLREQIQDFRGHGTFSVSKVDGLENPANGHTKALHRSAFEESMKQLDVVDVSDCFPYDSPEWDNYPILLEKLIPILENFEPAHVRRNKKIKM